MRQLGDEHEINIFMGNKSYFLTEIDICGRDKQNMIGLPSENIQMQHFTGIKTDEAFEAGYKERCFKFYLLFTRII